MTNKQELINRLIEDNPTASDEEMEELLAKNGLGQQSKQINQNQTDKAGKKRTTKAEAIKLNRLDRILCFIYGEKRFKEYHQYRLHNILTWERHYQEPKKLKTPVNGVEWEWVLPSKFSLRYFCYRILGFHNPLNYYS